MYLGEMYGISMSVTSRDMSELTHNIGTSSMCSDSFFECHFKRDNGLLAWDTHGEDKARQGDHGAFRGRRPGAAPVIRSDMMWYHSGNFGFDGFCIGIGND